MNRWDIWMQHFYLGTYSLCTDWSQAMPERNLLYLWDEALTEDGK